MTMLFQMSMCYELPSNEQSLLTKNLEIPFRGVYSTIAYSLIFALTNLPPEAYFFFFCFCHTGSHTFVDQQA